MNKEVYERTAFEVERFSTLDVITTSLEPEDWEMPANPGSNPGP